MKLSRFSSRQNANRYWSLYFKSLWKGFLCHIRCVVLQLPSHRKEWSWARKTQKWNSVQFVTHCLILITWVQKMLTKPKSSILNFWTQLCYWIGSISGIQHWKGPIGHLFGCSCILSRNILCFEQCDDIRLHYVHGQSNVDRGFNIDDDIVVDNLRKKSLIAQRFIYDHMHAKVVGAHDIVLTDKLRWFCLASSSKRKRILAKNKK